MNKYYGMVLLVVLTGLLGCQSVTGQGDVSTKAQKTPEKTAISPAVYAQLRAVEEAAYKTQDYKQAARDYVRIAQQTPDLEIIQRGVQIGLEIQDYASVLALTALWKDVDNEDKAPALLAIVSHLKLTELPEAADLTADFIKEYEEAPSQQVDIYHGLLPEVKAAYLSLLDEKIYTLAKYPAYWELLTTMAYRENDIAMARHYNKNGLAVDDENMKIIAQNIELNAPDKQIAAIAEHAKRLPRKSAMQLHYIATLKEMGMNDEALAQAKQAAKKLPNNKNIQLTYALLLMEAGKTEQAQAHLLKKKHLMRNMAYYYLGELSRDDGVLDKALGYFLKVKPDDKNSYYYDARVYAAGMLAKQGKADEAMAIVRDLAEKFPDKDFELQQLEANVAAIDGRLLEGYAIMDLLVSTHSDKKQNLIYTRSLLQGMGDDLALFEPDMRYLLSVEPDNIAYMNALGYTLADNNVKLAEAEKLLKKALEANPDSAAINDSWGWLQFRLGHMDVAQEFLEAAHAKIKDGEIAAHLGELYWVKGEREKAQQIWREQYARDPYNHVLNRVMKKFTVAP